MGEISASTIATMRYAPESASAIELYNFNGAEGMTISQLVLSVTLRCCAVYERNTAVQLCRMGRGVDNIEMLSTICDDVLSGKNNWSTNRNLLIAYGIKDSELPQSVNSYSDKMSVADSITRALENENGEVDRVAVEVETAVNRRDTQYRTATETIAHLGKSVINTATCMAPAGS